MSKRYYNVNDKDILSTHTEPRPNTGNSDTTPLLRRGGAQGLALHLSADRLEWPTFVVAAVIYSGFALVTWHYPSLPWWLALPFGGFLIAWHGSLQHEVVHGHPTSRAWLNHALVLPSLWLWMPFGLYRRSHLAHHRNRLLTDPVHDPESYYQTKTDWSRHSRLFRGLLVAHNTLLGRLIIGPPLAVFALWRQEAARLCAGDRSHLKAWLLHGLGSSIVLVWVIGVCGIAIHEYVLFFVYPGISLTLLRSFAEHQAAQTVGERTAIIEAGPFFSLLFLNNNLHAVHHGAPRLPWYRLPAMWRRHRAQVLAKNGGYLYRGYGELAQRHLWTPKEPVVHPHRS